MALLIAAAGLTGSGKTTALEYIKESLDGRVVYLGATVLNKVREAKLPETRESERAMRLDLRKQNGPAALAMLEAPQVARFLTTGTPILIDAIYHIAEFNYLKQIMGESPTYLLSVEAPFEVRCERLALRPVRPFTVEEVRLRDQTEIETLRSGEVFAAATHSISNDSSIQDLHSKLDLFLNEIAEQQ